MPKKRRIIINKRSYELIETIGNGGSGDVWKAQSNGKEYAIKIIRSDDSGKIKRFKNETDFCKKSNHENIIKIIADGKINSEGNLNGKHSYVMPLYPQTLKSIIDTEENINNLIDYILKLCTALKYIHKKGVVHRDIKPGNILISQKDLVLADFGIAHFKDFEALTKKGNLLANRNYAAPEQKIIGNAKNITQAADIFALGLIINECITKHNPSGSYYKLIADNYPLYADLDNLVADMMSQNPEDRPGIESVITEIKFIHNKINQNLKDITITLNEQTQLPTIRKDIFIEIIQRASEDILFGEILFTLKSAKELNKYNHNWHMKIGYTVDDLLFNLYVQERIYAKCKAKFEYESNAYREDNWYKVLDLENNEEHKMLYKEINNVLSKYSYSFIDLSGKILKYFSACADYHCIEILEAIASEEILAKNNLKNAPIILIVQTLKNGLTQSFEYLSRRQDFNFTDYIAINTEHTETYLQNYDDTELYDNHYKKEEEQIQKILSEFQKQWEVIFSRISEDDYSIKFKTYSQFDKFRKFALELSKSHYIFEGDVMHILKHFSFIGDMVELKLSKIFDIPNTIAKIIGKEKIYY